MLVPGRVALAGCIGVALSFGAHADDLASIYQAAMLNNAQYRSAEAQFAAVREHVPESTAALLPSLSVSANTLWNYNNSNTLNLQQYNSNGYTVSLVQPVWRYQNVVALEQSRSLVEQGRAQLELVRQQLIVRTAQAYFDVLYAEDALDTFREQRVADEQQLKQAERGFELGATTITDVRDVKARHDLVAAQEIGAANDVVAKMQALEQIINRPPGKLAHLRAGVVLMAPVPATLGPWQQAAESNNAAVVAAQAGVDAARLEVRKAEAAHQPTLDFVASHGFSKSATNITVGTDLTANTVGLQFSVPIYSGGGVAAKVREDIALTNKANADLDDARRSGVLAAQQSFLGVTSGLAQVRALEEAVASSLVALESNKRGVAVGARINIDVLNAQQELAASERDLAKARYETLMSLLKLKAAAGSLEAGDIDEVNALLER